MFRVAVLLALVSVLWLAGPDAWAALAADDERAAAAHDPVVELDRVGFRRRPDWLNDELLIAVMEDLAPRLQGEMGLLDEAAARELKQRLESSPWVDRVILRRVFPDRLGVDVELRRPVIEVHGTSGSLSVLADARGRCLPPVVDAGLPRTVIRDSGVSPASDLVGQPHPDPRVTAAASVAREWRDELLPLVTGAPTLVEVDAGNLNYRLFGDGRWSEVLVGVSGADGQPVYLAYGHPPGASAPRVPTRTKAEILTGMMEEFPGLHGIARGDLRFANRWRDWLQPRAAMGER